MEKDNRPDELDELYDELDELYDDNQAEMEEEDPKKDKVIQNKMKFLLLCLLVFSLPVLWFFAVGNPISTNGVYVGEVIETEQGTLNIHLGMVGSATAFTVTTQEVEGDTLIIKPRFSLVGIHKSGVTNIETKVPVDEVDYIYIQGDDETDRILVWNSTEG